MQRKIFFCAVATVIYLVVYITTNHFHLFEPSGLPLLEFEKKIPFLPWTVWIYTTDYVYLFVVVFLIRSEKVDLYFYSFMVFTLIVLFIFVLFPTVYPRGNWEVAGGSSGGILMNLVRWVDTPANCFPSAHIGTCVLGALFIKRVSRSILPIFTLWTILISISTLTTKQHYFLDIVGGIVLAYISYYAVFNRWLLRKIPENLKSGLQPPGALKV